MFTILVGVDGRPSMRGTYNKMQSESQLIIRKKLKKSNTYRFNQYTNHIITDYNKLPLNTNISNSIIVRWGTQQDFSGNNNIIYNMSKNLAIASNKKKSRQIFIENNIACPKMVHPRTNTNYPVIARPEKHSKGKNFVVFNNRHDFARHYDQNSNNWYYSEFINKVSEFRIHVAHGRVLNYLEKPKPEDPNQIAWNRAVNGEAFNNVKWSDYNSKVCDLAIKAIQSLGLDFGGVDIIVDQDGNPYVLEVNCSPTLASSDYSMTRYAMYFDWLAKSIEKRKHWDLPENLFKKGSNYAWHSYHFEDREPNK